LGKLFSSILNIRLCQLIDKDKLIAPSQIGFTKKKRTSDHIFVLKAIIEEAKAHRKPIFACFVDLKKAFDTVWRDGLLFKLISNHNLDPKFVRLIKAMYSDVSSCVKINNSTSEYFKLAIGLRQGCTLSPQLFNLYIDDLSRLLDQVIADPVVLNSQKITSLMYADDMVILSHSQTDLQKGLYLLETYCNKWQLEVNISKTKIMVFNQQIKDTQLKYQDKPLEIVHEFTYLGIKFDKSGSFNCAKKELAKKAQRAYFHIKSVINKDGNPIPKLSIKLFDSLVKPILLYCSEVWGGFGQRRIQNQLPLFTKIMFNDCTPHEKLNIQLCKQTLKIPKRASNIGARAELGRIPISKSIIVAVLKYYARSHSIDDNSLLRHAFMSQYSLTKNSYNSYTFTQFCKVISHELGLTEKLQLIHVDHTKNSLNYLGKTIKNKCIDTFKDLYNVTMMTCQQKQDSKLLLYSILNTQYSYQSYLNNKCNEIPSLTKFRLSLHWLPIERGRYERPKLQYDKRICSLCNTKLGNEYHALMECESEELKNIRTRHLNDMNKISPALQHLSQKDKFIYIMKCQDKDLIQSTCQWIVDCNNKFQEKNQNK